MPTPKTLSFHEIDAINAPIVGAKIVITLSGTDFLTDATLGKSVVRLVTDSSGNASTLLIPNSLGNQATTYNVTIEDPITGEIIEDRNITMPDADTNYRAIPTTILPATPTSTLAGFGILDAYTAAVIDALLADKLDLTATADNSALLDGSTALQLVISTLTQTALNLKLDATAQAADSVLLGGNTALQLAISTAAQTALNLKANISDTDTTTEIDAKLAALVDSSPGALDTLNELAAALGDDANFSTTITNLIATKLNATAQALDSALLEGNNALAQPISTAAQTALDLKLDITTWQDFNIPALQSVLTGLNVVAVAYYDTSKDSDGGASGKKTDSVFTSMMLVVVTASNEIYYDISGTSVTEIKNTNHSPLVLRAVSVIEGNAYIATSVGLLHRNLFNDTLETITTDLVNSSVNDIAVTVLDNAPIDNETGLRIPTVACITGDSLVLMADDTTQRIDQIKVGSFVKSLEGNKAVLNWWDQGVKDVVELEFDEGHTLVCTPDHKIRTTSGWVEAQYLTSMHEVVGI